jgi:hypothetical protein
MAALKGQSVTWGEASSQWTLPEEPPWTRSRVSHRVSCRDQEAFQGSNLSPLDVFGLLIVTISFGPIHT